VDSQEKTPNTSYTFTNVTAAHSIGVSFKTSNELPVADAGPDQTVAEGALVTLKGSSSRDAGGSALVYLWEKLEGPDVELSSATAADPPSRPPMWDPKGGL